MKIKGKRKYMESVCGKRKYMDWLYKLIETESASIIQIEIGLIAKFTLII